MIVDDLRKSILDYAIKGFLTQQNDLEKTNVTSSLLETPFKIPCNWKWCRISEMCDLIRGNGIKRTDTVDSGIKCIRYGEIYTNYSYSFTNAISFVTEELASNCKEVKNGDLLITLTGENEYDIAKATAYLGNEKLVSGGDLAIMTNHKQNPLYLSYFFASPFAINQKSKTAKGNIIVHTSIDKIGNYIIPLPPLEEQQRIVNKIQQLFLKLNEVQPIEDKLIEIKNSFPNEMKNSILNSILSKYTDNMINLSKISIINGGYAFKSSEYTSNGIRVIRISDFDENGIKESDEVRYKYDNILEQYKLENNDIIMCMTGGTVGKNVLLQNIPNDYYTNQRVATIKINNNFIPKFVYYCINSPHIQKMIQENKNSTNDNISMGLIKSFPIPNISMKDQHEIVNRIEKILPLCNDIETLVSSDSI